MLIHMDKNTSDITSEEGVVPLCDSHVRHQIERRAFEIWMSSDHSHGNDVAHWLQAEKEVMSANASEC